MHPLSPSVNVNRTRSAKTSSCRRANGLDRRGWLRCVRPEAVRFAGKMRGEDAGDDVDMIEQAKRRCIFGTVAILFETLDCVEELGVGPFLVANHRGEHVVHRAALPAASECE